MPNNDYTADDIQVLSDVGHMRKRPSMYIGELTDAHHLFNEAYDNAIDEVQSGYSDRVDVIVDTSNRMYTVRDYGRGIPHGVKKLEDGAIKPVAEVLCTKSFSGGKFDNSNFKISIGLNGLGLVAINSLSNYMKLASWRADDNRVEGVITSQGKVTEYINDDINDNSPYGTEVTFSPDSSIFTQNDTVPVDFIRDRCRIANAFGVKTHLTVDGVTEEINSDIYDLMPTEDSNPNEFLRHTFRVDDPDTGEYAIVAFKYTSETNCMYRGYTNLLYNSSGGTHHKMIDKSFTDAWSKFNISDVKSSDYFLGLRVVVAVFISNTEYSSQTKEKLTVPKSRFDVLGPKVTEEIYEYLKSNDDIRKGLIKKFQEYRASKNKMLATKEIRSLLYINNDKSDSIRRKSVVRKLVECTSRSREGTELYICLAGDTKVKLLNDTTPCIKDLVGKSPFWIYSIDDQGEFIPALAHDARITQYVTKMIKLTLSDGSVVECTPEHRFLSGDTDDWIEAQDLEVGSSLLSIASNEIGYSVICHHTHDVVNIEYIEYENPIPVYCLTVDSDSHAFTLANDLITHNCEGDSARGSVVAARNPVTQAALSIRGKILNVTKMGDIRQCMNNAEVHDIVNSIGAGLFDQCDPAKSRYERVIILADADADGCFTGDTEILMSDGSSTRIDELAKRYSPANPINGLVSTDKYSNKVTAHGIYPRITRWVDHFINLQLNDGSVIKCTLDHKFRLSDGSYKKAIDLTENDELLTVRSDESHPVKSLVVKNSYIDIVSRRVPVYDLTVPGYSNFVVKTQGNTGVAVHNCQISMLLLALFINVLPELVKAGMVYIAQPPLYGWKTKSGFEFTNTRSEVPDGIQFTRYKGLGEMDPDEMAYSLLDDNTRMPLLQLQYPDDINQFNQVLTSSEYKYDILYELGLIKYT